MFESLDKTANKIRLFSILIIAVVLILCVRIVHIYGVGVYEKTRDPVKQVMHKEYRHDIVDRNNNILATSVTVYNFYINSAFIININVIVKKIKKLFPELNEKSLYERLSTGTNGWFLITDNVDEERKNEILNLGIEGAIFEPYKKRFYPYGEVFAHVIGYTLQKDGTETGFKGVEKAMNKDLAKGFVKLSLDATVQSIIYENLLETYNKFNAKGAFAILVDLETREIISSISLPSFNPMEEINPNAASHVNLPFSATFNLGSVFKVFTIALGLENGIDPAKSIPMPHSIPVTANFSVTDEHRTRDSLTLEEILAYSSNVGVALITQKAGFDKQREFFSSLMLFQRPSILQIPLGEIAKPIFNSGKWPLSMHYTASYGYGISISPIHFVQSAGGMVYDGQVKPLTFLYQNPEFLENKVFEGKQIVEHKHIKELQKMMRSVVEIGTARRATINGYSVCGKTGTAVKFNAVTKKWDHSKKLLSFFSVFPCETQRYAMYVGIDEPDKSGAFLQASNTVVQTSSNIIKIVAPMLNLKPDKETDGGSAK